MKPDEFLREVIPLLTGAGITYMVVGSFAASFHGEPRTTHDLDLVIDPTAEQLEQFLASIDMERFYVDPDVARDALRRRSMFNLIEMGTGWKLDLFIRKARPFSLEELSRRKTVAMFDVQVATATAEDTVIAKLEWAKHGASDRQIDDVATILRVREDLDHEYIERWVSELDLSEQWQRARDRR